MYSNSGLTKHLALSYVHKTRGIPQSANTALSLSSVTSVVHSVGGYPPTYSSRPT